MCHALLKTCLIQITRKNFDIFYLAGVGFYIKKLQIRKTKPYDLPTTQISHVIVVFPGTDVRKRTNTPFFLV